MLDQKHPTLYLPEGNPRVWRYMDFTRLLAMFENRKLIIPRADRFDDPYEGMHSQKTIEFMHQHDSKLPVKPPVGFADQFIAISEQMRRQMFVTCWCTMDSESAALWKLYLQSREGIAILSDYSALCRALEQSPFMAHVSLVRYVDYDKEIVPFDNTFTPFLHKRTSFAHEHELRGFIWSLEQRNETIPADMTEISVDVNAEDLIKTVYVSPVAPSWFGDLVEQIVQRYKLKIPVIRSSLYARPPYLKK